MREIDDLGIRAQLRYVPGHSGIEGYVRANYSAKRGAKYSRVNGRKQE